MPADLQVQREQSWVDGIREGDERAFEELFHFYYPSLCTYAASYVGSLDEARSVVQEVFLRIWERRKSWRVRIGVRPYLYQAVRNRALNQRRRRRPTVELGPHGREQPDERSADGRLEYAELSVAYRRALDELPERRRAAFVLHREHGLTCAEIARVMEISERTVETHIGKALFTLREKLAAIL